MTSSTRQKKAIRDWYLYIDGDPSPIIYYKCIFLTQLKEFSSAANVYFKNTIHTIFSLFSL